jgi:histidyl-tRNA synthetase
MSITKIKGFADLFPPKSDAMRFMERTAGEVFGRYGYGELRIPILERTELFSRSIGEETDVVQKEMYTFPDRKGRSLTLRPEATAGVMRALIESKTLGSSHLAKLYSCGPMFRYERPQKGRMRQFHQVNAECVGPQEAEADAEVILMLWAFLTQLGLKALSLELNSLGCRECRPAYKKALEDFFAGLSEEALCSDCGQRRKTNPLRLLDCKVPGCRELTAGAPEILDMVCEECRDHFEVVRELLDTAGVEYNLNPRLVRGLDYYVRTTFEVVSGDIGAQSSVAGGGRYDGLIRDLGGPDIPGVGFACGMERLALLLPETPSASPDFYIAPLDKEAVGEAFHLARTLRSKGYAGEAAFSPKSMKAHLRQADKSGARWCLMLGPEERATGTVLVKNMSKGEQESSPVEGFDLPGGGDEVPFTP